MLRRKYLDGKIGTVPLTELAVNTVLKARCDGVQLLIFRQYLLRAPGGAKTACLAIVFIDSDLKHAAPNLSHG